ncbi:glucosamine-6-phosphate deaminase [Evansella tamaricis]|uniref:Glucosamine-6-phosphate deaminase n=1 Tax=Evansella tamaricis TaxID=2069301 RepID=A0ABS6JED7_9BACI|nr:glucosamine-6-phosphate deaminase [Evansella tamaricis]MBU9711873.1 glucosamine-6-phosphate deaminase [Evansella tamaricis]
MKLIVVENYGEMSRIAADMISKRMLEKPDMTLGLATGGTPTGMYQELIAGASKKNISFKQITTVNLDEYVGLEATHPNSYRFYMNDRFFQHIDIDLENTFVPNGAAADLAQECHWYDETIKQLGGIDLQVLGIGTNGHIGFNEPGTPFDKTTHVVELTESTRKANERFFSEGKVPTHAITMGIKTIMQSKEIVLLSSGEKKADALQQLVEGSITNLFPASVLKLHNNLTIVADQASIKKLDDCLYKELECVNYDQ